MKRSNAYFARIADLPKETRDDGTQKRTAMIMDHALMTFVWLEPGYGAGTREGRAHHHSYDQLIYQISGRAELWLGGDESTSSSLAMRSTFPGMSHTRSACSGISLRTSWCFSLRSTGTTSIWPNTK